MTPKLTLFFAFLALTSLPLFSQTTSNLEQRTSINTDGSPPDASAMLDVQSTAHGVLVPRMTSVQRTAIASPAMGLLVFDTDTGGFWFYDGGWQSLSGGSGGSGSSITDGDNDTRILTESVPDEDVIRFETTGSERMHITPDSTVMQGKARVIGSFAGGGESNQVWGDSAFVGAGFENYATGNGAFIGGGHDNLGYGDGSFIGGGQFHYAPAANSFIGTGEGNIAAGINSFLGGGIDNETSGTESFVGGGYSNSATNVEAAVCGGFSNTAAGQASFIGGGEDNIAFETYSVIAGGYLNYASGTSSAIGGGENNSVSGLYSFIGGGTDNNATQSDAAVLGGSGNTASGMESSVGGGLYNTASGQGAFVAGGSDNTASAVGASVIGGNENTASGEFSITGGGNGLFARSYGEACFGLFPLDYSPTAPDYFDGSDRIFVIGNGEDAFTRSNALTVLKNGNVGIGEETPSEALHINGNILTNNGGDIYTSATNGVINAGGGIMNANVNIIADAAPSPLNASSDNDLYIEDILELGGQGFKPGGGVWMTASDVRLKTDIRPYTDGLEHLMKINPVRFRYNDVPKFPHPEREYIGIIAQEVQAVAPYMVSEMPFGKKTREDENGHETITGPGTPYLTYDGSALTYMLVNAVQEQQELIEQLRAEIIELKQNQLSTHSSKK